LTRRDAGMTADTSIEIDAHAPGGAWISIALIERSFGGPVARESRVREELAERALAHEIAAERARLQLNGCEGMAALECVEERARRLPKSILHTQLIGIEPDALSHGAR